MNIRFSKYNRVDGNDFVEAMKIYIEAFPSNERQSIELIKYRIQTGENKLYLAFVDDVVVSIAILWNIENSDFILLDYLAVKDHYRDSHIGSEMMQFISNAARDKNKHLLIDLEHPMYGSNRLEREKRLDFYLKNGAFILKNTPYYLPSLDDSSATEMLLLIIPLDKEFCFKKDCIYKKIKQNYF